MFLDYGEGQSMNHCQTQSGNDEADWIILAGAGRLFAQMAEAGDRKTGAQHRDLSSRSPERANGRVLSLG